MCLGTFGRLARSLVAIYIFERVLIPGTLVPLVYRGSLGISYYIRNVAALDVRQYEH